MKTYDMENRVDGDVGYFRMTGEEYRRLFGRTLSEDESDDMRSSLEWYAAIRDKLDGLIRKTDARLQRENSKYYDPLTHLSTIAKAIGDNMEKWGGRQFVKGVQWSTCKIVFVLKGPCALKISALPGGMEDEISVSERFPDLTCFPKLLAKSNQLTSAVVECVFGELFPEDMIDIYGLTMNNVVHRLGVDAFMCDAGPGPLELLSIDDPAVVKFLGKLRTARSPEWQVLRDLRRFFKKVRPLEDISTHNWGYAIRNNKKIPVVFDYDF